MSWTYFSLQQKTHLTVTSPKFVTCHEIGFVEKVTGSTALEFSHTCHKWCDANFSLVVGAHASEQITPLKMFIIDLFGNFTFAPAIITARNEVGAR